MKVLFFLALLGLGFDPEGANSQNVPSSTAQLGLTNEDIFNLAQHSVAPDQIISLIQANKSSFDLSQAGLSRLRSAALPESILNAMFKAALGAAVGQPTSSAPPAAPSPSTPSSPLLPNVNLTPGRNQNLPASGGPQGGGSATGGPGSQVPKNYLRVYRIVPDPVG